MTRYFSNIATPTTLAADINNTDVTSTITVNDVLTGWPGSYPFTAIIDKDTASEEMVLVTNVVSTVVTVTRAQHGYGKYSHSAGATFVHAASAQDFTDFQAYMTAATTHITSLSRGTGSYAGTNHAELRRNTNQVVAPHVFTDIGYNGYYNIKGDNGAVYSGSFFKAPVSGMYLLSAQVTWPLVSSPFAAYLQWYSPTYQIIAQNVGKATNHDLQSLTTCAYLASNTELHVRVTHDSAGNLTLYGDTNSTPNMATMVLVA